MTTRPDFIRHRRDIRWKDAPTELADDQDGKPDAPRAHPVDPG